MATSKNTSEGIVREIKRKTRRIYNSEEKIRIILEGLRGEDSIAEICRREGIHPSQYYKWSKEFLEAGKKRLNGDTAREATSPEVNELREENDALKALVAELSLKNRVLKKKLNGFGIKLGSYMKYRPGEKHEIIRLVEASSLSVRKTLAQIGVSKSSFYQWYRRYLENGIEGLKDCTRSPRQFWNRIPDSERECIVERALDEPALSCREVAMKIIDEKGYFVSESSVYRILKAAGLVISPAFAVQSAKDKFQHPTTRINELWQTDFTYFKITGWGWYYLSTVMDDFSRMILAWKLCSGMSADDVTDTLDRAIEFTGVDSAKVVRRTRLLSDNGPCYISKSLQEYLEAKGMDHTRGRPFHPMTQGQIERYHRSMKNIILLDNYYLPMELEVQIDQRVEYYNKERYHESLGNITPRDKYLGREEEILERRRQTKEVTMNNRREANRNQQWRTGISAVMPVS